MQYDDSLTAVLSKSSRAVSALFSTTERRYFSAGGLAGVLFTGAIMMSTADMRTPDIAFPSFSLPQSVTHVVEQASALPQTAASQLASTKEAAFSESEDTAFAEEENEYEMLAEMAVDERFPMNGESIVTVELHQGDTLSDLLSEHEIQRESVQVIINAMRNVYSPRKLRAGQQITLELQHKQGVTSLNKMEFAASRLERVEINSAGEKFAAKKIVIPTTRELVRAGGTITSSFYEAGIDAGLTPKLIVELMKAYSYDVDFARDIRPGQSLDVMFEQVKDPDGNVVGTGALKYATLHINNKKLEVFRYADKNGFVGYYTPSGESIRKALIKTPINGARISSGYGMRRHPVLGYSKMHKGLDFAAPRGTPVYAAGDGVIDYAARRGSYGNYVKIKHNGTYSTAYAHLHRFAKGMRKGKRVKQGQVIAYVGTTGRSTGPHLHYEILQHGRQVNPRGVKFRTGQSLSGRQLADFKRQVQSLKNQFAKLPRIQTHYASAN